jgi:hypothetical protein
MLLGFFKRNDPYVLVLIPLLGAALLFNSFQFHRLLEIGHFSPLFSEISWLIPVNYPFSFFIVLVLAILYSTYLIRLNTLNIIYESRTYLEGVIFMMLVFGTSSSKMLYPAIIGSIFLLFSLNAIFRIEKGNDLAAVYNSGFFLSIGSMFFFDLLFYLPFIWIAMGVIKSVSFREWLVTIIGFITPLFILAVIYYLTDDLKFIYEKTGYNFMFEYRKPDLKISEIMYFGFVLLLFVFSLIKSATGAQAKKIRVRKMFFIFNMFSIIAIALLFITGFDINHWITATCFLSIVFTRYFIQMKSLFWGEILFFLLTLSVLAQFIQIEI